MFVLWSIWWAMCLFVIYTLAWFLSSTVLFLITKGQSPPIKMSTAAVLGGLSALLHILVCSVKSGVCGW